MKRFLSIIIAVVIATVGFGGVASAETVHKKGSGVTITEKSPGFSISGKIKSGKIGMVSIEFCDAKTYSVENPIPSVVHRDQITTAADGTWSYTVNMTGKPKALYNVKISDTDGDIYHAMCEYTGTDSKTVYNTIPRTMSLGADETNTLMFGYGMSSGKFLMHFKADLPDNGESELRFLTYDGPQANMWTGYDTTVDIVRYDGTGWGTGTELDTWSITNVKAVDVGSEHTFDVWVDLDRRLIIYYMDGEYWETIQLDKTSDSIWGCTFRATNSAGENTEISEFEIIPYIYGGNRSFSKYCMPDYITESIDAYYTTENVGNIFYNPADVSFNAEIINREKEKRLYNYITEICDENDVSLYSEEKLLELEAEEQKDITLSFDLNKADKQYGLLKLKTYFKDTETDEVVTETETEFLSVRKPSALNKKIGNNVHFGHYMGDPYINMNLLKNAGFSSARDFVDYASYTGEVGFSRYDSWQGYAEEYGIDRLVILMGYDTATYGGVFPTTAEGRKNYTDYAVGVAKRLKGDAAILELWNEMDWRTTSEQYALMLLDTVPAIKKVNDTAKIAVMCPARVNASERRWMQGIIDYIQAQGKNPADYMDIVSVHPYTRNIIPEASECECGQESDSIGNLKARVAAVRKMLDNEGLSKVKLISTEMGYYSTPNSIDSGRWNGGKHQDGISERQQADYSIRTVALLHKDLDHMQFYVINKTQRYDLSEDGIGMTKSYFGNEIPYKGKPVYAAMAAFNDLLGNAEIIQENESGNKYDYVFKKPNGKNMHLMWTTLESATATVTSETGGVYVYDIYGNRTYQTCNGGKAEIALTGSPVYVEEADFFITDQAGNEFSSDSEAVKVTAYVTEEDLSDGDARLICAAFDDGVLVSVKIKNVTEAGAVETEYVNTENADEVRAFMWNNMKPISGKNLKINR